MPIAVDVNTKLFHRLLFLDALNAVDMLCANGVLIDPASDTFIHLTVQLMRNQHERVLDTLQLQLNNTDRCASFIGSPLSKTTRLILT